MICNDSWADTSVFYVKRFQQGGPTLNCKAVRPNDRSASPPLASRVQRSRRCRSSFRRAVSCLVEPMGPWWKCYGMGWLLNYSCWEARRDESYGQTCASASSHTWRFGGGNFRCFSTAINVSCASVLARTSPAPAQCTARRQRGQDWSLNSWKFRSSRLSWEGNW